VASGKARGQPARFGGAAQNEDASHVAP
jgi:hypothetical protein